jgi:hypothetical protein
MADFSVSFLGKRFNISHQYRIYKIGKYHNESPYIVHMQTKMSFCKNGEQEGKTGPVWILAPVRGRGYKESVWKGEYDGNIMYACIEMEK